MFIVATPILISIVCSLCRCFVLLACYGGIGRENKSKLPTICPNSKKKNPKDFMILRKRF